MNRDMQVGLALAILLIGVVGALFFRNEPRPQDEPRLKDPAKVDRDVADPTRDQPKPYLDSRSDKQEAPINTTPPRRATRDDQRKSAAAVPSSPKTQSLSGPKPKAKRPSPPPVPMPTNVARQPLLQPVPAPVAETQAKPTDAGVPAAKPAAVKSDVDRTSRPLKFRPAGRPLNRPRPPRRG